MSEAVDTRIVEAKFDSKQFEQGVDRTVKKLDELKKSLNLEEAGQSVAQMTEKASNALQKLEDRFTTFTGMIKNKILGGLADEITGVFFKIKNGFESMINSISSAQVNVGMGKYEQMLTSVRTMVAAGDTEEAAYEAIERLGLYADQTSYSLDQMTSALSKMRAAGVDLKTGTKAVEGISNACAAAGVNATDASRAFFNLSQAYSSGYLKYTDYRSLELLNMTTENFKKQMLDAAVEAKTLKKVSEDVYQTIKDGDKKVTAGKKVTVKSLSDSLKYNFMNTEAMNKLFGEKFFFDEEEFRALRRQYSSQEEALAAAKEKFGEVAVNAYYAAREAKSFTDVMNTLKDVVSRGWSRSFELIFGKLGDASKFFTWLTESNLAEFIYFIGDFRNGILEAWNESGGRDNLISAFEKIDKLIGRILQKLGLYITNEDEMRQVTTDLGHSLREATRNFNRFIDQVDAWFTDERINRIKNIFDTITSVFGTIFRVLGIAFNFMFNMFVTLEPVMDKIITNIDKVVSRINALFNTKDEEGNQTEDGLTTISTGLDNILKVTEELVDPLGKVIDFLGDIAVFIADFAVSGFVSSIQMVSEAIGFFLELMGKDSAQNSAVAEQLKALDEQYNSGEISVEEYLAALDELPGSLGTLAELKKSILEIGVGFSNAFGAAKDFFTNLYEDLRLVLGLREPAEGEEGGFFSNIKNFFETNEFVQNVKETVTKALDDIKAFILDIPNKIGNLWAMIDEFLFGKKLVIKNRQKEGEYNVHRIRSGFSEWLYNAVNDVKKWITTTLPTKVKEIWTSVEEFFLGKKICTFTNPVTGKETTIRLRTGFSKWLNTAIKDIKKWITVDLPKKIKEIWDSIDEFLFGRKVTVVNKDPNNKESTTRVKEGFASWLDQAIEDVKNWITTIPEKISQLWANIIDFLFYRDPIEGEINPETNTEYGPTDRVKNGFRLWLEALPGKVWNWITNDLPGIVDKIWNTVLDFILGPKVDAKTISQHVINPSTGLEYKPNERVRTGFYNWLTNIPDSIGTWISDVLPGKLRDIWTNVVNFIFGDPVDPEEINPNTGEEYGPNARVKTGFSAWLDTVVQNVKKWLGGVPEKIKAIWDTVLGAIFGNNQRLDNKTKTKFSQAQYDYFMEVDPSGTVAAAYKRDADRNATPILDAVQEFIDALGIDIGKIISDLPSNIINGLTFGLDLFDTLFQNINSWMERVNKGENISEALANSVDESKDKTSPLLQSLLQFGEKVKKLFTDTLPGFITQAFTWIGSTASGIWEGLTAAFTGKDAESGIAKAVEELGAKIRTAIEKIPKIIQSGLNWVKSALVKKKEPLSPEEMFSIKRNRTWTTASSPFKKNMGQLIDDMKADTKDMTYDFYNDYVEEPFDFSAWISEMGQTIVNVFAELGPYVIKGLNKLLEWIGKGLTWLTGVFNSKNENEDIGDAVTRAISGGDEDSQKFRGLADSLTQIGQTIEGLITNIIPKFIESGINVLMQEAPKILSKIGNIFGDGGEAEASVTESGESMTRELENAMNEMTETLTSSQVDRGTRVKREEYISALEAQAKDLDKESDEYKELIAKIEAAKKLQSEYIKEVDKKSRIKQLDAIVAEKQKNFKEVEDKLHKIYGPLKTIALTEDPLYIMAKAEYDAAYAERHKLNKGTPKDQDWAIMDADSIEEFAGSTTSILDIFDTLASFGTSKTMATVAVIASLAWAISSLKDMLSITDEMEASASKAKWTGITVALSGITAIMGYITYLAAQKDQTAINNVLSMLDRLTGLAERIGQVITVISAIKGGTSVVKSIADAVGAFGEGGGSIKSNLAKTAVGALGKTLIIGGVAISTDLIMDGLESVFTSLGDIFVNVGTVMDEFMDNIGPAIDKMDKIKGKMEAAIDVMGNVFTLIHLFYHSIDLTTIALYSAGGEGLLEIGTFKGIKYGGQKITAAEVTLTDVLEATDSGFDLVSAIEDRMTFISTISLLMNNLAASLKTFEDIKRPKKQIQRMLTVIRDENFGAFISELFTVIFTKLYDPENDYFYGEGAGRVDFTSAVTGFQVLGEALAIFGNGIEGLTTENVAGLREAIGVISDLSDMIYNETPGKQSTISKLFTGDKSLSTFAQQVKLFGQRMKGFFIVIKEMPGSKDVESYQKIRRSLKLVTQVATDFAVIVRDLSYIENGDALTNLGETFSVDVAGLGVAIMSFMNDIESFETVDGFSAERVKTILEAFKVFSEVMTGTTWADIYHSNDEDKIKHIKEALVGKDGNGGFIDVISDIRIGLENVKKKINIGEDMSFDFDETVDSLNVLLMLVTKIGEILSSTTIPEGTESPFHHAIDAFSNFNANFDTVTSFMDNVKTLDQEDIDKAAGLFGSLHDLAETIHYFGNYTYNTGIGRLQTFDLSGFVQAFKDNLFEEMQVADEDELFSPKITPVLELTDDFISKANQMRALFGYQAFTMGENGQLISPENNTSDLTQSITELYKPPIDYTDNLKSIYDELSASNFEIRQFNNSLSKVRFVINGREFADAIGEDIDWWLGKESVYVVRVNGTS